MIIMMVIILMKWNNEINEIVMIVMMIMMWNNDDD